MRRSVNTASAVTGTMGEESALTAHAVLQAAAPRRTGSAALTGTVLPHLLTVPSRTGGWSSSNLQNLRIYVEYYQFNFEITCF